MFELKLSGDDLTIGDIGRLAEAPSGGFRVSIAEGARRRMHAARETVRAIENSEEAYYGVNTGFGPLCTTRIEPDRLRQLQENLLLSRAVGMARRRSRLISSPVISQMP